MVYLFLLQIQSKTLSRSANSAKLIKLSSNTRYLICVLGLSNWLTYQTNDLRLNETNQENLPEGELNGLLTDTLISRCTEVRTLDATLSLITDENGLSGHGIIHSILTRRLGLIVGCCLGIIVFIVLISVLGYLKLKKQRIDNSKRQPPPAIPPEYISYRHFSIPHEEGNRDGCYHPNAIMGTTMLNA